MLTSIISFFKSFSFFKGILKTIAVLIPLGLGYAFDVLEIGLPIALSVVAISPSDIPGNQRHLYGGLLVATLLAAASSALGICCCPLCLCSPLAMLTFRYMGIGLQWYRSQDCSR